MSTLPPRWPAIQRSGPRTALRHRFLRGRRHRRRTGHPRCGAAGAHRGDADHRTCRAGRGARPARGGRRSRRPGRPSGSHPRPPTGFGCRRVLFRMRLRRWRLCRHQPDRPGNGCRFGLNGPGSVPGQIARVVRHQRQRVRLAAEHREPEIGAWTGDDIVGQAGHHEPGTLEDLVDQLLRVPPGTACVDPDAAQRSRDLGRGPRPGRPARPARSPRPPRRPPAGSCPSGTPRGTSPPTSAPGRPRRPHAVVRCATPSWATRSARQSRSVD